MTTASSDGDTLRLYVARLGAPGTDVLLEVGRSIEPEKQALQRLQAVLGGSIVGGLLLALAGGYALAGRALRPIRAAVDSQRMFIADASHELRSPLAVIRANAEVLERHIEEPVSANKEAVADIISEAGRLGRLVGQMLTLAQADSGQPSALVFSDVDFGEIAEDVGRTMRRLASQRWMTLETDIDHSIRLRGDPDRLRELLFILLDNAIKYSGNGAHVRLELHGTGRSATLRVNDSGPGIPPDALPYIFDRFYRVDKSRSRAAGGSGLGLAIAKWIAEAHGGAIRAESTVGAGTTFIVDLPSSDHVSSQFASDIA